MKNNNLQILLCNKLKINTNYNIFLFPPNLRCSVYYGDMEQYCQARNLFLQITGRELMNVVFDNHSDFKGECVPA